MDTTNTRSLERSDRSKKHPLVTEDVWLSPFNEYLLGLTDHTASTRTRVVGELSLKEFSSAHHYFGLFREGDGSWVFRERLPYADKVFLIGDFSQWEEQPQFLLSRLPGEGVWEVRIAPDAISHGDLYKLKVYWSDAGKEESGERIPPHSRRVVQDSRTNIFSAQVWSPMEPFVFRVEKFPGLEGPPLVYEAHIGMSSEEGKVSSYEEFRINVLPRIQESGYNVIQLMAIQEHPYYGSFGYQVANFYAPSSRFGTPEELKRLIDDAHCAGIAVIMDIVHSHAVKNEIEGISRVDGSYTLYCHGGDRFEHPAWNTRLFDYGKAETLHFLLSNCRYWNEEFKFDGFRFDGVTSMLYYDHGLGRAFDSYESYFTGNLDKDAVTYLTLANELIHDVNPHALTVAEDMSGLPGLAAPLQSGGVGFDYRLSMGVPDYWIKLTKDTPDEEWNVSEIFRELTNKRADEQVISYCESHDQALVGDKTLIFRLADKEMYSAMRVKDENIIIDRAIALHKLIRLLTVTTAGDGYLNFMGNEFGHPEWIDFPREGNGWSYHYARRQWSLCDDPMLRYHQLAEFDKELLRSVRANGGLLKNSISKCYEHVANMLIGFARGGSVILVNLHPLRSQETLEIPCAVGHYRVVCCSDDERFGGFGRVDSSVQYESDGMLRIYLPTRTGIILARV